MKKQQPTIDEIFREALGGHREVPPPAAWNTIEQRLDEQDRRRRAITSLRWPWMLGLLLTLGAGTWLATGKFNEYRLTASGPAAAPAMQRTKTAPARVSQTAFRQQGRGAGPLASVVAMAVSSANSTDAAHELPADAAPVYPINPADADPSLAPAWLYTSDALPLSSAAAAQPAASGYAAAVPQAQSASAPRMGAAPLAAISAPLLGTIAVEEPAAVEPETYQELLPAEPLRFTFGADLGYEQPVSGTAPGRFAAGISLSWEFSPGLSLSLQPAYRFGQVKPYQLSPKMATRINQDIATYTTTTVDTANGTVFHYVHTTQAYDSVVTNATSSGGGRFFEVSLPVMLSYQNRRGWSVGAGPTLNFGGAISGGSGGDSKTYHIVHEDSMQILKSFMQPAVFSYNNPAGYTNEVPHPAAGPGASPQSIRLGYMLNIGYRWRQYMLNASLSQQLSGYSDVDKSFRGIFSSPYIRLSLGYRLPFNLRRPRIW